MLMLALKVIYVLIAIAMIAMILMQRGAGAQAGSGFGAGASATVFGSRGASNFLSKSTKWLAIAFFAISLFMAWHINREATTTTPGGQDLGLMGSVPAAKAPPPTTPAQQIPAAPAPTEQQVPAAPAQQQGTPPAQAPSPAPSQGG
jgi:preprotein translocase subunit SecG